MYAQGTLHFPGHWQQSLCAALAYRAVTVLRSPFGLTDDRRKEPMLLYSSVTNDYQYSVEVLHLNIFCI